MKYNGKATGEEQNELSKITSALILYLLTSSVQVQE